MPLHQLTRVSSHSNRASIPLPGTNFGLASRIRTSSGHSWRSRMQSSPQLDLFGRGRLKGCFQGWTNLEDPTSHKTPPPPRLDPFFASAGATPDSCGPPDSSEVNRNQTALVRFRSALNSGNRILHFLADRIWTMFY